MAGRVKLAFWGTGMWATLCLQRVRLLDAFEIVGCFDQSPEAGQKFAAEAGCATVASEEALFAIEGLQAVCIFTPNHLHRDQVTRAVRHGLHVFVEKPMAYSVEDCRVMLDAAREAGVTLFVGHNTRREQRFRRMRVMIEQGAIGRPVMAEINFTSEAGLGQRLGGWRYDRSQTPAVALAQIGIHAIDVLHSLLGPTCEVQAWIGNVAMENGIEDVCMARLGFAERVNAMFLNAYSVPRARGVILQGTGGSLYSDREDRIEFQPAGAIERELIKVECNDTVREEFEEFAACCRGERVAETDGNVGLAAIAVMEAMLSSARHEGRIERLQLELPRPMVKTRIQAASAS